MSNLSRRTFLGTGALVPFSRVLGANDAIRLGVVGVGSTVKIGGKGKGDARDFAKIPGVRVVALCDVDRANLDPEVKKWRDRGEKVEAYTDVRKLLENKDIDAVSVTTPNHWHALVTIWACQAGKDVFVQKPASHNIFEGRKMVEAAPQVQAHRAVPQRIALAQRLPGSRWSRCGRATWARSATIHGVNFGPRTSIGKVAGPQPYPRHARLRPLVRAGADPAAACARTCTTTGTGTGLTATANWATGAFTFWTAAAWPSASRRCRATSSASAGASATTTTARRPTRRSIYFDYEPAPIIFEMRGLPKDKSFLNTAWDKSQNASMDTYCGIRQGTVIHCEGGYIAQNKAFDKDGKLIRQFEPTTPNLNVNFIEAMRSRRVSDLAADILDGHLTVSLIHMSNISYRIGKTLSAGEIKERITGKKELLGPFDRFKDHLSANNVDVQQTDRRPAADDGPNARALHGRPQHRGQQTGLPRLPQAVRRARKGVSTASAEFRI